MGIDKTKANWLDRVIGIVSPRTALTRIRARYVTEIFEQRFKKRGYEGAGAGRRFSGWDAKATSANTELRGKLGTLRDRSRDLIRNNPYAARGIKVIDHNAVGSGIMAQIKDGAGLKVPKLDLLWDTWARSKACDYDGVHDFYGLQRLVMRTVAESGEVLIRKRRVPRSEMGGVPVKLQVLEPDFLAQTLIRGQSEGVNEIIQGIEVDPKGRRVAYHLYETHPGESFRNMVNAFNINRVPADEIMHVYMMERPGQLRGVPFLAPVMLTLRDFDDFCDAQLMRQKIAACFAAFIYDTDSPDLSTEQARNEIGDKVEPGIMEFLPPGKDIKFSSPPGVENYQEYTTNVLRSIAAGLGVTYEALTGDYSQVNFSSGRMGWLEFQRNIDIWRNQLLIPQFCDPAFQFFLQGAELVGAPTESVYSNWTPPKREMIDPTKEISAKIASIRAGLTTLSEAIREEGRDPAEHLQEIAADNAMLDKLKIILDIDPRNITKSGFAQDAFLGKDGVFGPGEDPSADQSGDAGSQSN